MELRKLLVPAGILLGIAAASKGKKKTPTAGPSPRRAPAHWVGEPGTLFDIRGLRDKTTPEFRERLVQLGRETELNPNYLAAVMAAESGFNANIQNIGGAPALGLIQFWRSFFPPIAERAGIDMTWEDLRTMDAVDQLDLVFAYYEPFRSKLAGGKGTPTDYYMAVFLPAFIGKDPEFVLGEKGSKEILFGKVTKGKIYEQNKGLDAAGDGLITVRDIGGKVERILARASKRTPIPVPEPGMV